jgi:hypothetical protein
MKRELGLRNRMWERRGKLVWGYCEHCKCYTLIWDGVAVIAEYLYIHALLFDGYVLDQASAQRFFEYFRNNLWVFEVLDYCYA